MTRRSAMMDVAVPFLHAGLLVVSVWIVIRGHNEPGGGFIGGMIAVAATAVRATVLRAGSRGALPIAAARMTTVGVALALVSGLGGLMSGDPYLTHQWATLPLGVTSIELSTVLLFDVGVYFAVWGALGGFAEHMIAVAAEDR